MVKFLVADCLRGRLSRASRLLACFFVLAISLKYNKSLGSAFFPGLEAISRDRSLPLLLVGPLGGDSTFLLLGGDGSGVLYTLVVGVELNSEQTIEPELLQPVLSSIGAAKVSKIAER